MCQTRRDTLGHTESEREDMVHCGAELRFGMIRNDLEMYQVVLIGDELKIVSK